MAPEVQQRPAQPRLSDHITQTQKINFLKSFSEDDFRDKVVRPLFERQRLKFARDLCGPDEEGKDCFFLAEEPLGKTLVYAVQTKRGDLSMGADANKNIVNAVTQLRTALATEIVLPDGRSKARPNFVHLVASGKISKRAREFVAEELDDPRVVIEAAEELIPRIDDLMSELWLGIDADRFPYLRGLQEWLQSRGDVLTLGHSGLAEEDVCPLLDDNYVNLRIQRTIVKLVKKNHRVIEEPEYIEIPFESVFRRPERLVLVTGEGGGGKTTGLRRLAFKLCEGQLGNRDGYPLPLLLNAVELGQSAGDLIEVAAGVSRRVSKKDRVCFTADDLASGSVAVLIDALDEATSAQRDAALEKITRFATDYPKCLVVVTSREYRSVMSLRSLGKFAQYTVVPITVSQAAKIIDKVGKIQSLPRERAQEMLRRLQDVHGMSLSPMLVTVFVASSDFTKQDIPPNIAEIFARFTELLLGRWDAQKGLKHAFHYKIKDHMLRKLAFEMHSRKARQVQASKVRELFERELSDLGHAANVEQLYDETVNRSGILRADGEMLEFSHQLLQEFFAGRGIPRPEVLPSLVVDEWWRTPIVFYFGDHPQSAETLLSVAKACQEQQPVKLFDCAATIGLASQACYMSQRSVRVDILTWVVAAFANSFGAYVRAQEDAFGGRYPTTSFLAIHAFARDSVASSVIEEVATRVRTDQDELLPNAAVRDAEMFWCITGLIEIGDLETAEPLIAKYAPEERRYVLALLSGLFLVTHARFTKPEDKKLAEEISRKLWPRVGDLIAKCHEESRTFILEWRRGELHALPDGAEVKNGIAQPAETAEP